MSGHTAVLLPEALTALAIKEDGIYLDATFGRGGHSRAILEKLSSKGKLVALDKDLSAVKYAQTEFAGDSRFTVVHSSFAELQSVAAANRILGKVDGILMDLGVSSPQLDTAERGFSFNQTGPLDMRMNQQQTMTVATWLAQASEQEIARVIFEYGEERYSRRIAKAIVAARNVTKITTTEQLAKIIKEAHPNWEQHKHPATRTFQALRIFINNELDELKLALQQSAAVLKLGGRLVVIAFHSLEDRIVKQFMSGKNTQSHLTRHLPVLAMQHQYKTIAKAIKPSAAEIAVNVRSRSAVLRVAERIC